VESGLNSVLKRLATHVLLICLLLSCAVSCSFLLGVFTTSSPTSLASTAKSPNELVESIKKLAPSERSALVSAQVLELTSEPLGIESLNNIAILEALGDHPEKSESVVVEAARRSLRDVQSQLSAMNILLSKRAYKQASFHIDGLLRSQPKLEDQLFKVLVQLQKDPEGLGAVAALMKDGPPWRGKFLQSVLTNDATGQAGFQLLAAIRKAGGKISDDDLRHYIGTQIGKKNYEIAYFTWLDSLDEVDLRSVSFVYDGKFDHQPRNQFFDWTIYPYANAEIGVSADPGETSNQVLRLSFLGGRDAFGHVRQYMKLAPAVYDVKGRWQARNFQSPSGLRWQLYCVEGAAITAASSVLAATDTWEKFGFTAEIPPDKCETQFLQLQSASSAVLDQRFDGQFYVDDMELTPAAPGDAKKGD
jgi:hypothetical protein